MPIVLASQKGNTTTASRGTSTKKTGWTGANLARMERGTMIRKLTGLLVPEDRATRIVDKIIKKYVKEDKSISLIPPCK